MDENQVEDPKPSDNPRNAAMAEIAKQAHAEQAPDLANFDEATGVIEAKETVEAVETTEADPVPVAEPKAEPKVEIKRMVSIVVDGNTIDVDEEKIIEAGRRALQKDTAADRRLQEAAQAKREAEALRSQMQRASQDPAYQAWAQAQDTQQTNQPATQGFDPAMLAPMVKNLVYTETAAKAATQFWADFPDIAEDPYLRQMAAQLEQSRLDHAAAVGEPLADPATAYRKHGETIRDWLKKRAPAPEVIADKAERKRTITTVQSVNAKAPTAADKKPPTVSETIEAMRQQRSRGRIAFQNVH